MTPNPATWAQLELSLHLTPAMRRGEQTVWQCAHCGSVIILSTSVPLAKPGYGCPGCGNVGNWWKQSLPLAGFSRTGDNP